MSEPLDGYEAPDTLFGRLRAACAAEWEAYCTHEFVRGLRDGSLPESSFRHYLRQDYLFLIHFARAWALAVYKADTLSDMREAASTLRAILEEEMALHVKFCAGWGLTEAEMESVPEAEANMAYTRFVLEQGVAGDILDLHVALAPCVIGYGEIGARLAAAPDTIREGNPYADWIETYAGEAFQGVALDAIRHLDRVAARRMGPGRFEGLRETFRRATRLEIGFWQMGLHPEA